jgi:hypothetical protein
MTITWRDAAYATLHCLTGCAIGEVLGMILATALGWGNGATIAISILLAFVFGYALTTRGLLHGGLTLRAALPVAFAADSLSILTMEIMDNTTVLVIPGAMAAGLTSLLFWGSLALSLGVAFLAAWPVNRWLMNRGMGHAKVHETMHGHMSH